MRGFVVAKSLHVAARLGIADELVDGPRGTDELANACHVDQMALHRLLRALSSIEVFSEVRPQTFALGRLGMDLVRLRNWVLVNGGPIFRAFDDMLTSVRTGRPAFDDVFGASFFDYFQRNPGEGAEFNAAMDGVTRRTAEAVARAYDFTGVHRVVDVGGGTGVLLDVLLREHPQLSGVLFDQQHVIDAAPAVDRCELMGGDFFDSVPGDADLHVLAWVLHDWDDDRALAILRNCRRAMSDTGRLLVIEAVLPTDNQRHFAQFGDIVMLVALGGRERTEDEYQTLLDKAGLRLSRVVPTSTARSVLEAVPA